MATKKSPSRSAQSRPANPGAHRFLIPTGGGAYAYVRSATTNANPLLKVGSPEFDAAIAENAEAGFGEKILAELAALHTAHPGHGWDRVAVNRREAA